MPMGHPRHSTGPAVLRTGAVAVALVATACSTGNPPEHTDTPTTESAALRVETISGADELDERTRAEVEGAVSDVLSAYVVEAFLGDFPRQEFVSSFESFTSGAARSAAGHIDLLTAASVRDATDVRATELDARLSFLTEAGDVHGGTAAVHFAFEATMEDGTRRPLALDGRFLLDAERDAWSIFGYDVTFDDGEDVDAESVP
jgi:hypothetical protein